MKQRAETQNELIVMEDISDGAPNTPVCAKDIPDRKYWLDGPIRGGAEFSCNSHRWLGHYQDTETIDALLGSPEDPGQIKMHPILDGWRVRMQVSVKGAVDFIIDPRVPYSDRVLALEPYMRHSSDTHNLREYLQTREDRLWASGVYLPQRANTPYPAKMLGKFWLQGFLWDNSEGLSHPGRIVDFDMVQSDILALQIPHVQDLGTYEVLERDFIRSVIGVDGTPPRAQSFGFDAYKPVPGVFVHDPYFVDKEGMQLHAQFLNHEYKSYLDLEKNPRDGYLY